MAYQRFWLILFLNCLLIPAFATDQQHSAGLQPPPDDPQQQLYQEQLQQQDEIKNSNQYPPPQARQHLPETDMMPSNKEDKNQGVFIGVPNFNESKFPDKNCHDMKSCTDFYAVKIKNLGDRYCACNKAAAGGNNTACFDRFSVEMANIQKLFYEDYPDIATQVVNNNSDMRGLMGCSIQTPSISSQYGY